MWFSIGLVIWWICNLFYTESEEFTLQDGGIIVGEILMMCSVISFAWKAML